VTAAALVGAIVVARAQEAAPQEMQVQAGAGQESQAQAGDPPSQVARIGLLLGNVSVEPASVDQFSAAEVNAPMTTGDRIYADAGANAELQGANLAVRLGQLTDLTVTAMTDSLTQFGLAQGSIHLVSYAQDGASLEGNGPAAATLEVDTPNVAVTVLQAGDVRVDVDPNGDATTVTVVSGQAQVQGNGLEQTMQPGQRARFLGSDPVAAQWLYTVAADGLDRFSSDRDAAYESALAAEQQDVNPGTIGAADLAGAGDWEADADEGPIWYPAGVAVGWQPYSCGRWAWVAPWGWTWVECESWGFAPFHYGRWVRRGPRWGWLPGPRVVRPIYAPALVVFVGGAGATAWFPLGPHEPYVPWYSASAGYVNRVNVTNLYDRNAQRVRMALAQRSAGPRFGAEPGGDAIYANRQIGTVAVSQASFAAGRPVSAAVRVDAQELASAPVLAHPMVTPQRSMVVSTPARAVPRNLARPELAAHGGEPAPTAARPNTLEPATQRRNAAEQPAERTGGETAPAPVERQPVPAHTLPLGQPATQPGFSVEGIQQRPAPAQPQEREAAPPQQPAAQPVPQQPVRPLYNRAVPPEPRPSFEQQQRAMESTDPGRPLNPEQMQQVRRSEPVQPAPQRETPHPQPAPKPAPPPRPAPPVPVKH
jgi:hypothetical protein